MSDTRDPNRDQPLPTGNGQPVQAALISAIAERSRYGQRKYGTVLRTHNGRDALVDAWEEALDLVTYLTQMRLERGDQLLPEQPAASEQPRLTVRRIGYAPPDPLPEMHCCNWKPHDPHPWTARVMTDFHQCPGWPLPPDHIAVALAAAALTPESTAGYEAGYEALKERWQREVHPGGRNDGDIIGPGKPCPINHPGCAGDCDPYAGHGTGKPTGLIAALQHVGIDTSRGVTVAGEPVDPGPAPSPLQQALARAVEDFVIGLDSWSYQEMAAALEGAAAAHYATQLAELANERARFRTTLIDVLSHFTHRGHPGEHCLQTGWISERTIAKWRDVLGSHAPYAVQRLNIDRQTAPEPPGEAG